MTIFTVDALELRAQSNAKPQTGLLPFVGICVLSALVGRLAYLYEAFNGDGAMFAYMGKMVVEGERFGVDLIDNKFPTVGLITSIFWRAFGNFWPGYVIAQMGLALTSAMVLTRAAVRSFGAEARWATFLPALVLLNLNSAVMGGFQLETIQTFFVCLSAACALEALRGRDWRDALAAGMCAGCATWMKPTGGGVLAAFAVALVFSRVLSPRSERKLLLSAVIGFLIPLLAALWWLITSDQLTILPDIARQIGEYASSTSFDPLDLYRPLSLIVLFAAAMLIRGWVFRRRAVQSIAALDLWLFIFLWLMIEFAGVLMQRRMYAYHFLPLAAPAAILFGALPRRTTTAQLAGVLALPLLFGFWGSVETVQSARQNSPTWPAVTRWLRAHTGPGERIWRDLTPYILLHSDLRPASRIQLTFIFMNSDVSPQRFANVLIDDLRTHRPRYIVLPASIDQHIRHQTTHVSELARVPARRENFAGAWKNIDAFVQSSYEPVKQIRDEMIWQRRD